MSPPPLKPSSAAPADALADTRLWLERAVIGLELCPFAKAVHVQERIRWVLTPAASAPALLEVLVSELQRLAASDPQAVETTLLVHPQALLRFRDFNDFLGLADEALRMLGLEGELQIASFHPQYRFAGSRADDIANCSNRSPHPTLHLLREASITRAVAAFPDAGQIYERNIQTLRQLGAGGWRGLGLAPRRGPRR
jgi:hypothetical protein